VPVCVGVAVFVGVLVGVAVFVGVLVGVAVFVGVDVLVDVLVGDTTGGVLLGVCVGVFVLVGVVVGVGVILQSPLLVIFPLKLNDTEPKQAQIVVDAPKHKVVVPEVPLQLVQLNTVQSNPVFLIV
jgi:hypothetical protein